MAIMAMAPGGLRLHGQHQAAHRPPRGVDRGFHLQRLRRATRDGQRRHRGLRGDRGDLHSTRRWGLEGGGGAVK